MIRIVTHKYNQVKVTRASYSYKFGYANILPILAAIFLNIYKEEFMNLNTMAHLCLVFIFFMHLSLSQK